ncbi:MAG: DUF262 domain-containing protein [Acidobacteria bacterium]|nr:DUF262 domain-containing protein [Acidobacteriota bacterium]
MKASETNLQSIIEGVKQYVVPLFQRSYSWDTKEWGILLNDILELYEEEKSRAHFIGSIVTMQTNSVPEGVPKFALIDGQQRLTTIFIIFSVLRDLAIERGQKELAEEINHTLLVNSYKKNLDYFKLLPTQVDRICFQSLIKKEDSIVGVVENQILKSYQYFSKRLKQLNLDLAKLQLVITNRLSVVSIVLYTDDNPYLVFESLNAKGRPLTQADLIKNFLFMRINVDEQEQVYAKYWMPMQEALGDKLTEFIGHYLMKNGLVVKQNDIYFVLKDLVNQGDALTYLKELSCFATYYQKLLFPEKESNNDISYLLKQINRIEVTTAYPFLLNCYDSYSQSKLSAGNFIDVLKILENFLVRRFVCGVPTTGLNKIFPNLYSQIQVGKFSSLFEGVKTLLQSKDYPKDFDFKRNLVGTKLYGAGNRIVRTKLILEAIELFYSHKEKISFDNLTIEHVMPQTLDDAWKTELGDDWQATHELLLHSLGNLTLTAYNSELSNDRFELKKVRFANSHLELNKYFADCDSWTKEDIEERAEYLSEVLLNVWPYFGESNIEQKDDVTKTAPVKLRILGQDFSVKYWRDVLINTLNVIAELDSDKFDLISNNFSNLLKKDKSLCREPKELKNGWFVEANMSAKYIEKFCRQIIAICELDTNDWQVELSIEKEISNNRDEEKCDQETFFQIMQESEFATLIPIVQELQNWARLNLPKFIWSKNNKRTIFWPCLDYNGKIYWPIGIRTDGQIEIIFQYLKVRKPFDNDSKREELLTLLNNIPGVNLQLTAANLRGRPKIPLSLLKNESALKEFINVLDWIVHQIKS